ncbi:hypothetical protein LAV73_13475 [Lysinibacillus xylanilyticus]|uniref:hypothetical protein n=1 Tax=Lysinibacillus xylanilyticus TaxID=582475 RepID=UPI002B23F120|nr:hypothetical protein [Lysinibacillus xylanilyticus]MEB2281006.1 hypothetical protein [Lysinibacillus xylanilyticus]
MIGVETGRLLGISVTDETLERASRVKRLIGLPQEALLCAKAKRQQQSAQSERKSTIHFAERIKPLFTSSYLSL